MKKHKSQIRFGPAKSKRQSATTLDPLRPGVELLSKLGSMIVHADEAFSPDGHLFDREAFQNLLKDADVQAWMKAMGPLLPVKRVQ